MLQLVCPHPLLLPPRFATVALRWPVASWLLRKLDELPGWLRNPRTMLRLLLDERLVGAAKAAATAETAAEAGVAVADGREHRSVAGRAKPREGRGEDGWGGGSSLGDALSEREEDQLARALGESAVAFRWRQGDVLLLDNARILHDGLPGYGRRSLYVALLGECVLPQSLAQLWPGVFDESAHQARLAPVLQLPPPTE